MPDFAMEIQEVPQAIVSSESRGELHDGEKMEDMFTSTITVEILQEWNHPRINMYRVFATFYSFFIFGMNDGAYGVS